MKTAKTLGVASLLAVAGLVAGQALRLSDKARADRAWAELARDAPAPARFDPRQLAGLPEPAQRYFRYAIAPGAELRTVAEITMQGRFSLGSKPEPGYMPMRAREILAPPRGFVWLPAIGSGLMTFSGSDGLLHGQAWTRFWALGLIPVARASGGDDLARSAAARLFSEAALWSPASMLPGPHVRWEAVDVDTARVVFQRPREPYAIDLTVAPDGRPLSFVMQRWSNANADKVFRSQPFGGTFAATRQFGDYTIPSRVSVGNHFGTDAYFPFFEATVTEARFR
ncbi:DUF6544 family protein [Phenylobacterium sp.]|jgi:hypothetical protein|uniref:DUF6544 family protein n=1 Tax=Phenylobacterium sp. TaxID=1871053 RepID=UPI002E366028|nr:DUF6544 family protein [Phenylobacterium sp.]HEX2560262.1 DUF6544 family protein [Phenylobacterium sp.]